MCKFSSLTNEENKTFKRKVVVPSWVIYWFKGDTLVVILKTLLIPVSNKTSPKYLWLEQIPNQMYDQYMILYGISIFKFAGGIWSMAAFRCIQVYWATNLPRYHKQNKRSSNKKCTKNLVEQLTKPVLLEEVAQNQCVLWKFILRYSRIQCRSQFRSISPHCTVGYV